MNPSMWRNNMVQWSQLPIEATAPIKFWVKEWCSAPAGQGCIDDAKSGRVVSKHSREQSNSFVESKSQCQSLREFFAVKVTYQDVSSNTGWWFQSLWKILVSWDVYSQYMEKQNSFSKHFQTTNQNSIVATNVSWSALDPEHSVGSIGNISSHMASPGYWNLANPVGGLAVLWQLVLKNVECPSDLSSTHQWTSLDSFPVVPPR